MKAKSLTPKDFSHEELEFIRHHSILIEEVIDVTGMVRIGQKRAMEARGARIAINGGRCTRGHRFKTRSNHCPQCEPKNLAFERRHTETAFVYICTSETGLIKVGSTKDPADREARLNREAYASCTSWRLVYKVPAEKAGQVEFKAHAILASKVATTGYLKAGREVSTYEVFACTERQAIEAVKLAMNS